MVSTVGITAQTAPETAPEIVPEIVPETAQKTPIEPISTTALKTSKETARDIAQQMSQECVARRLRQVNRTITRLYDEALRPHGLTVNQLNILAVVISEKQIRPGQLGQSLGMEKSTVSRTVDRMVRKDWLKVTPGTDGRTQLLTVTAKGRKLLLNVTPIWDNLQAGVLTDTGSGNNILQLLALDNAGLEEPTSESAAIYADEPVSANDFYL
ncbi:MAG: MarR family winged helix-turn-helix transcriptional regulator [Cyanobacteria bacterium P01_D01_bin.36]